MKKERIDALLKELEELSQDTALGLNDDIRNIRKKLETKQPGAFSTWDHVKIAREIKRPGTLEYVNLICDDFMELHGDRYYGDDPAMVGGIGIIDGRPVTIIGNQKGSNMKESIARNYGMGSPEGYRKALRLAKQAEKFQRPVIFFVDTPGAYPGIGAEERGIGEAIARNLKELSILKTPSISFIIGEGGSGGALGIGISDKLYMLEHSIYSVITPEGFASILLRDSSKAKEAAAIMKMTSEDIMNFNIIHGVIPEPPGGAHENPEETAKHIKEVIKQDLGVLCSKQPEQLVRYRLKKIRSIGHFDEQKGWWKELFSIFSKSLDLRAL
ncbi:MAG: acetyl-CoA carboxylase carboxyltransferase subunit alpha [Spirochaetales bacterium]|nr:acetyl-CoA carboxylase carboxyltransferase subunit alpha [Spirochaetales bacterium]